MIMGKFDVKYLQSVRHWSSAAVLVAAGLITNSLSKSQFSHCYGTEDECEETIQNVNKTQKANASADEVPWWRKIFGAKPQTDEILEKFVTDSIRVNEQSNEVNSGCVRMFETNWIAANKPIEDRHSEYLLKDNGLLFFGVFDGHSGWHCSETVRKRLPVYTALTLTDPYVVEKYLKNELFKLESIVQPLSQQQENYKSVSLPSVFYEKQKAIGCGEIALLEWLKNNTVVDTADGLKKAFVHLDNHICSEAIPEGKVDESLLTGIAGSCAIVALVEHEYINIANAGDCRAVLGNKAGNGNWKAIQLSSDHCAENKAELKRLHEAHPDQKGRVVTNGRLLGQLQPLRAFGDVQYKWSLQLHELVLNVVYGRPVVPPALYRSPPYLTAEPEITRWRLQSGDQFLILATDGLWEKVSNELAVKIIGDYIDNGKELTHGKGNGATRLIRYALGKGSDETVSKMLQIPDAYKRNFHDDITITVIFFKDGDVLSKL